MVGLLVHRRFVLLLLRDEVLLCIGLLVEVLCLLHEEISMLPLFFRCHHASGCRPSATRSHSSVAAVFSPSSTWASSVWTCSSSRCAAITARYCTSAESGCASASWMSSFSTALMRASALSRDDGVLISLLRCEGIEDILVLTVELLTVPLVHLGEQRTGLTLPLEEIGPLVERDLLVEVGRDLYHLVRHARSLPAIPSDALCLDDSLLPRVAHVAECAQVPMPRDLVDCDVEPF